VLARGRLEHREGTTNVVVAMIERLERHEIPGTKVKQITPPVEPETGRDRGHRIPVGPTRGVAEGVRREPAREQAMAELAAALPAPHSFGRRGR
jgi:hypothetical protein